MSGESFLIGQSKTRPGTYVRVISGDVVQTQGAGIVATLFQADWGPLGSAQVVGSLDQLNTLFGDATGTRVVEEALVGGAAAVLAYRVGTGGAKSTKNLQDTTVTPIDVVQIDALYVGDRGDSLAVTVRDSLTDASKRELLVYEGSTLRETFTFAKGTSEPQDLVDAVAAKGSNFISATKLADGNGVLATANSVALGNGSNPTVVSADYTNAANAIEAQDWDLLCVDTVDASVHTSMEAYVDRVRDAGKRVMAVVGEPTSVALATRMTNAAAFENPAVVYVANGFTGSDGIDREGARAAARVAGMIAGAAVTESLTHALVANATALVGALTNDQVITAIDSGALVFTKNANREVQIEYGITTFTTATALLDLGWRKIRRVRTRDTLITRIVAATDPLVGRVDNTPDGRSAILAAMQGVINDMVNEGALVSGAAREDQANPPFGEQAWFVVDVNDLDSAEKFYITHVFRFAAV